MRSSLLPSHLIIYDGLIPENFPKRLESFKVDTGLSWDSLAACMGVDPRQLQRWRKGTKPSGDGLCSLIMLAARIPGGVYKLLGVQVSPPAGAYQPLLTAGHAMSRRSREG